MPSIPMKHEIDPAQVINDSIGDVSNLVVTYSHLLIGIYIRPKKTAGGILITDQYRDEDKYQGKVGLVLKKGPLAFQPAPGIDFGGLNVEVGQWVVIRSSDGWPLSIRKTDCRMVTDAAIRMVIESPDEVY